MPLVEWGQSLTGFWSFEEGISRDEEVKHGNRVEVTHEIVQEQPLSVPEMEQVVSEFVIRMKSEYPEHDVKYVAIERGSSLNMRVQLEENSPIPVGTLIEIIILVTIAAVAAKIGWEAWNIIDSAADQIKSFGDSPFGYALKNPGRTALILGTPVVGAVVVKEVYFE